MAGEDVAVDLEGEGDVGVPEAFADDSWVLADGEQVGGVGVPEAVEGEVGDVPNGTFGRRSPELQAWTTSLPECLSVPTPGDRSRT